MPKRVTRLLRAYLRYRRRRRVAMAYDMAKEIAPYVPGARRVWTSDAAAATSRIT